jgi:hypothetical protein
LLFQIQLVLPYTLVLINCMSGMANYGMSVPAVAVAAGREGCVSLCMTPIGQPCIVNQ